MRALRSAMDAMGLNIDDEDGVMQAREQFTSDPDAASLYRWEGAEPTIQNSLFAIQSGRVRVNSGYTQLGGHRTVYVGGVGYKGQLTEVPDVFAVKSSSPDRLSRKRSGNRRSMAEQIRCQKALFEYRTTETGEKLSVYVSANQLAEEQAEQLEQGGLAESGEEGCTNTRLFIESMNNDAITEHQSLKTGWDDTNTSKTTTVSIRSDVEQIAASHSINTATGR